MRANRGRRKFVVPGTGSAFVAPNFALCWKGWEARFGVTIGASVRKRVERAISVYRANAAIAKDAEDVSISKADFKRSLAPLLSRHSTGGSDLYGKDWKVFRLVQLLTPEMSGLSEQRGRKAVARFEIDLVPVVREIDAFSDAVIEICDAFSSLEPGLGKLTSLKWDDEGSDPKPIDQFLAAVLRGGSCDLAQVKSHRRALKRNGKKRE
jgi:hypothetical protein